MLQDALAQTARTLGPLSREAAHLEAEVLLMHLLGVSRTQLYCCLEEELEESARRALPAVVQRRLQGEPLAYIVGHKEFFGLDFLVSHHVLVPRPETELLVERALELIASRYAAHGLRCRVADIGTGSGAIAISLAVHAPGCALYATDVSRPALEVAAQNCRRHGVQGRIRLLHGDMLAPLPEAEDILVADLPYVREMDLAPALEGGTPDVWLGEPLIALCGGEDGLDKVRQLLDEARDKLRPRGSILLEIGWDQGKAVQDMALRHFPEARVSVSQDLAGLDRLVWVDLA